MEQIVIVLLILAFSGAEAFFRWLKKRQERGGGRPAPPHEQRPVIFDEDDDADDGDWLEELRKQQTEQRKREEEARRARQAQPVDKREEEREPYEFVIRQRAPEPKPAERAAPRFNAAERPVLEGPRPRTAPTPAEAALAARMAERATIGTARRKQRVPVREWLRGKQDLRRGVVVMEILGRPKGLE